MNPYLATLFTFIITLAYLRLMDYLAHRGIIESKLSRKIIHIGTGPIFVLCWLMYSDVQISRWRTALVPFVITIQFALIGTGILKDEAAVMGSLISSGVESARQSYPGPGKKVCWEGKRSRTNR